MKILEHRENPFPEDLGGRLNAVFNIVNTELKSATMLVLDDSPAEGSEIKGRLRALVGHDCYLPQQRVFEAYCHKTLFPIGAVAEETVRREGAENFSLAYSLTEAGKRYGRPMAAFTLDYVVRKNFSMFSLLGSTNSPGKTRAPYNRIKILENLVNGSLREVDLIRKLSLGKQAIKSHLDALKRFGLIGYDSCGEALSGKGHILYHLVSGGNTAIESVLVPGEVGLTRRVIEVLKEDSEVDSTKLATLLNVKPGRVTRVLSGLARQGFIRRKNWFGAKFLSDIYLLDKGLVILNEYKKNIADALIDGSSLKNMELLLSSFMNDLDKFGKYSKIALNHYFAVSRNIQKRPIEETHEMIFRYVKENPGIRPIEILRKFSLTNTTRYLTPLVKSGRLMKERQGKIVRYFIGDT